MSGAYPGPADPALRRSWRTERRGVVRHHHPDLGGDPLVMTRLLDAVDSRYRRHDPGPGGAYDVALTPASRWQPLDRALHRLGRAVRTAVRAGRARTPPGWPGHRRYLDL